MCDGTDRLTLVVSFDGQISRQPAYSGVLYELGMPFLVVTGRCRYWTNSWDGESRTQAWAPIRTGELSEHEVRRLADSIGYDEFGERPLRCDAPEGDVPRVLVATSEAKAVCAASSPVLRDAERDWGRVANGLYSKGEDLQGGLRVTVGADVASMLSSSPQPWPLDQPITDFVVESELIWDAGGRSTLVADTAAVRSLRELRSQFLEAQSKADVSDPGIAITGDFILYLRDEVPWTNERGILPLLPWVK